jgi:hypothetical protein
MVIRVLQDSSIYSIQWLPTHGLMHHHCQQTDAVASKKLENSFDLKTINSPPINKLAEEKKGERASEWSERKLLLNCTAAVLIDHL